MTETVLPGPNDVMTALLQRNYFPNHMHDGKEIPPIFSTDSMTPEIVDRLHDSQVFSSRAKEVGFDTVTYRLTRFNLLHRTLGIPHPLAYARLVKVITDHWEHISYVTQSRNSQFPIAIHNDGRISSMKYDTPSPTEAKASTSRPNSRGNNLAGSWQDVHAIKAKGKKYRVTSDISNFHPSIYTHSIAWASVGRDTAKATATEWRLWYNKLDKALRHCKRNETVGISTGPGTSTIAAEMILVRVDEQLNTDHLRYVDDYIHYTETYDEAEAFLKNLGRELANFGLELNPAKTSIVQLPAPVRPTWLRTLHQTRPKQNSDIQDILDYLDTALELASAELQESAVKFAVARVVEAIHDKLEFDLCTTRLLNLCAFFPNIAAPVVELCLRYGIKPTESGDQINAAIRKYLEGKYSDGASWMLYLAFLEDVDLEATTVQAIIQSGDVFATTLLACAWPLHAPAAIEAFKLLVTGIYDVDSQWVFWYEIYQRGLILENPYAAFDDAFGKPNPATLRAKCFDILKEENVSFVDNQARDAHRMRRTLGIQL